MTKREYRNYSAFFFLSSIAFSVFLINALFTQTGLSRFISCALFGFLIFTQLRVAFLMRRKSKELDLK